MAVDEPTETFTINLWERDGGWEGELRVGPLLDTSCTGPDRISVLAAIADELADDIC